MVPNNDTVIEIDETIPKTVDNSIMDSPVSPVINSSELISTEQTTDCKTPVGTPVADRTAKDHKLTPQERVNLHYIMFKWGEFLHNRKQNSTNHFTLSLSLSLK